MYTIYNIYIYIYSFFSQPVFLAFVAPWRRLLHLDVKAIVVGTNGYDAPPTKPLTG